MFSDLAEFRKRHTAWTKLAEQYDQMIEKMAEEGEAPSSIESLTDELWLAFEALAQERRHFVRCES